MGSNPSLAIPAHLSHCGGSVPVLVNCGSSITLFATPAPCGSSIPVLLVHFIVLRPFFGSL